MNISLRGQQGWMLLETIMLGLILIVAVSCLPLYQQAIALRQAVRPALAARKSIIHTQKYG